jgi:hypothetical protein
MQKNNSAWLATAALAAALLAGCGGGSVSSPLPVPVTGGSVPVTPATPTPASDISTSISDLFAYMVALINATSDSTDPVDINPLTLATDNAADATPVN